MNETQRLREVTQELSQLRQRPCLVLYVPSLHPCTVRTIHEMLGAQRGQADVVIRSPGGCLCCAYQIARELRRRFDRLGMFVPLAAKSAATLIALAADELVLGISVNSAPWMVSFPTSSERTSPSIAPVWRSSAPSIK
jgi:hypothetical protein